MTERRNLNRGYRKLRVWQDAKELYVSYIVKESNAAYGVPETPSLCVRPQKVVHYPTAVRRRKAAIRSSATSSSSVQRKEAL